MAAIEQHEAVAVAPPQPVAAPPATVLATPAAVGGAPMGVDAVLSLQRTAGNQAVCRAIATGLIQRDDKQVSITGVDVTPGAFSVPLAAGTSVKAKATPDDATGVKWELEKSTVDPAADTKIDATTGKITIGAKQAGGKIWAKGTSDDDASASSEFQAIEKPKAIISTEGSATGTYSAGFKHTFSSAGAGGAGLEGANVNETFDALKVATPFGEFELTANAAGSDGWDLDAKGAMADVDTVSIEQDMIDASKFVASASNPKPKKALPQSFSMKQNLFTKTFPAGTLDAAAFTSTQHVRTLEEKNGKLQVTIKSGSKDVPIDYDGPPVFRKATADKTTVEASPPKPDKGDWKRSEVQVSVDVSPSTTTATFSIEGAALGCEVDDTGKLLIGEQAGTIKVRAGDGDTHYDEVSIAITARAASAQPPAGTKSTGGAADEAVPEGAGAPEPAGDLVGAPAGG